MSDFPVRPLPISDTSLLVLLKCRFFPMFFFHALSLPALTAVPPFVRYCTQVKRLFKELNVPATVFELDRMGKPHRSMTVWQHDIMAASVVLASHATAVITFQLRLSACLGQCLYRSLPCAPCHALPPLRHVLLALRSPCACDCMRACVPPSLAVRRR